MEDNMPEANDAAGAGGYKAVLLHPTDKDPSVGAPVWDFQASLVRKWQHPRSGELFLRRFFPS